MERTVRIRIQGDAVSCEEKPDDTMVMVEFCRVPPIGPGHKEGDVYHAVIWEAKERR